MITTSKQREVLKKIKSERKGVRGLESAKLILKTYGFPLL
jgi:hypothetical protein